MRYSTYFLFQILFFIIVNMSVMIYIVSSPDQPCPHNTIEQACITLQEFATNFSTTGPTPSELTLELLPGFHFLNYSEIFINGQHTTTFIMKGSNIAIQCIGYSSMEFEYVQLVKISAINFINCGNAYINYMHCE